MNSGKIVADGTGRVDGKIEGSTRGPRGPKKKRKNLPRPLASIVLHCDPGAKAALAAATARSTSALKF